MQQSAGHHDVHAQQSKECHARCSCSADIPAASSATRHWLSWMIACRVNPNETQSYRRRRQVVVLTELWKGFFLTWTANVGGLWAYEPLDQHSPGTFPYMYGCFFCWMPQLRKCAWESKPSEQTSSFVLNRPHGESLIWKVFRGRR